MAGVKIVDLPSLGRDLISTDLLELSLAGGSGSRKITGQEIMSASKLNIGATPIINGTAGRVLFQGAGNVVSQSSNLFWDATNNRLGIGTSSPDIGLTIVSGNTFDAIRFKGASSSASGYLATGGTSAFFSSGADASGSYVQVSSTESIINGVSRLAFYTASTEKARIFSTGNIGINTTTDAGYKLDVNGTARVVTSSGSYTAPLTVENTGSASDAFKNVAFFAGNRGNASSIDDNTNIGIQQKSNIINNFATLNFFNAGGNLSAYIGAQFLSHSGGQNGNLVFGTTTNGTPSTKMTIFSTGNVSINTTTDAGFKLDVNGTARIQGTTTLNDVATCLQGLRVNGGYTAFNASTIFGSSIQSGNTFNFSTQYIGGATGTTNYFNFSGTLASATGGSFNVFNVQQTFSNTNSSQTFRGFYYNPNITGLQAGTAHWAIHTTSGRVRFEGLPTSPTGLNAGDLYNNLGVLMIV